MNQTEASAWRWLGRTYESNDIVFRPRRSPDFDTADGRQWEVKLARKGVVVFTTAQVAELMSECTILVWRTPEDTEPAYILRRGDIDIPGRASRLRFTISAQGQEVLQLRIDLAVYERVAALAREERRSINAQIAHLLDEATK